MSYSHFSLHSEDSPRTGKPSYEVGSSLETPDQCHELLLGSTSGRCLIERDEAGKINYRCRLSPAVIVGGEVGPALGSLLDDPSGSNEMPTNEIGPLKDGRRLLRHVLREGRIVLGLPGVMTPNDMVGDPSRPNTPSNWGKESARKEEITFSPEIRHVVAIIDDDPSYLAVLSRGLQRRGWQPILISSPMEAIKILSQAENRPLAIVSDMYLPTREAGMAMLSALQSHEYLRLSPIVVLSGDEDSSMRQEALQRGASFVISKRVDLLTIDTILHHLVGDKASPQL